MLGTSGEYNVNYTSVEVFKFDFNVFFTYFDILLLTFSCDEHILILSYACITDQVAMLYRLYKDTILPPI